MSDADNGDFDKRVDPQKDYITLTRNPKLSNALLVGPYPYVRNEQGAYLAAARDAIQQHRRETHPIDIVMELTGMATACDGAPTIRSDGNDLLIEADELDHALRISIRGGQPHVETVTRED